MARITRTRVQSSPFPPGTFHQVNNGVVLDRANSDEVSGVLQSKSCQDSHGRPVSNSPLNMIHYEQFGIVPVNGTNISGANVGTCNNFILRNYRQTIPIPSVSTGAPLASSQMATLLSRTNPSRPEIIPADLIQDLVDLPRMLKDVGKILKKPKKLLTPKEGANQYLAAKFGWLPLVQDIHDILDLQSHILRRKKELHRLYNTSSGLRRRLHLGYWSAEDVQKNLFLESDSRLTVIATRQRSTLVEQWGVVRWKPDITPGHNPSDEDLNHLARRVALGMTTQATMRGLWDVIPWTWMIDWFTNVRDFATQWSNAVPSHSQDACVMTKTICKENFIVTSLPFGYTGGGGVRSYERKERYVGPGTLDAHLPYISVDRLKILGALFIQRFKR